MLQTSPAQGGCCELEPLSLTITVSAGLHPLALIDADEAAVCPIIHFPARWTFCHPQDTSGSNMRAAIFCSLLRNRLSAPTAILTLCAASFWARQIGSRLAIMPESRTVLV